MSILGLLFTTKRAEIAGVQIDAAIRETHSTRSVCTENPVETGATVTDHVTLKPVELEIEGIITDTPVTFSVLDSATGLLNTITGFMGTKSRSIELYDKLVEQQDLRVPFKVVTGLKVYDNMILEDFEAMRDAKIGNAINFRARMKQIVMAVAKTTGGVPATAGNPAEDVKDAATKTADKGSVATGKVANMAAGIGSSAAAAFAVFAPFV